MYAIVLGFHVFVTLLLILAILIQSGKGSSLKEAFGGGSSDFGPGSPESIMTKITTILVIVFFSTSIILTVMSTSGSTGNSIVDRIKETPKQAPFQQTKPVVPTESK
jgi:preprotein translocase subunit SecG